MPDSKLVKHDTYEKFSLLTVRLHWLIAISIIVMLTIGVIMTKMDNSPFKFQLYGIHKSLGALILPFALWRIVWRMRNGFPQPVGGHAGWEHRLAKVIHYVLIIGTVLMPISGMVMSAAGGNGISIFGLDLIASNYVDGKAEPINEMAAGIGHFLHEIGGKMLLVGVVLHVAGALKHHIIDKDGTLVRMLGRRL